MRFLGAKAAKFDMPPSTLALTVGNADDLCKKKGRSCERPEFREETPKKCVTASDAALHKLKQGGFCSREKADNGAGFWSTLSASYYFLSLCY
jgi:hypothetical protein